MVAMAPCLGGTVGTVGGLEIEGLVAAAVFLAKTERRAGLAVAPQSRASCRPRHTAPHQVVMGDTERMDGLCVCSKQP